MIALAAHHPFLLGVVVWVAVAAVVLELPAGSILVALAPTAAVAANYYFGKRQRRQIAEENAVKVQEVHTLVNNRSEQQDKKIAELETLVTELRARLA